MPFQIKRIYDPPQPSDGTRVLVDRLWPRGVKKTDAHLDAWMKDVAPSTELRIWFEHIPARFDEFRLRYQAELTDNPRVGELRKLARGKQVTLLYAAHDPKFNHALVLMSVLRRRSKGLIGADRRSERRGAKTAGG